MREWKVTQAGGCCRSRKLVSLLDKQVSTPRCVVSSCFNLQCFKMIETCEVVIVILW